MKKIVDFIFETGFLKKLKRTGFAYLGSGDESVADHTCRVLFIAYTLGHLMEDVDRDRLLKMCLFHDLPEARTGELNYVNKRYVESNERRVLEEIAVRLPFGEEIASLVLEFGKKETLEAQIANDADQLDLIFHLKEQLDTGNPRARAWIEFALRRLETEQARQLARIAMETDSTDWWFGVTEEDQKI